MTASGEGKIRIIYADLNEGTRDKVFESRTEPLDVSTDPRQMRQVGKVEKPNWPNGIDEDDQLILEMKGDSATTVDNTSVIRIPIRRKNKRTGQVEDDELTGSDFGLTASDVAIGTGWTKVGAYSVAAQEQVKVGKQNYDNSQIYMQMAYT